MTLDAYDYELVRQRLARAARAVDLGDAAAVAACFTADGWFDIRGLPEGLDHAGKVSGTEALLEMHAGLFEGTQGHVRHWVGNTVITEIEPGRVRAQSYVMILRVGKVLGTGVIMTAVYDDVLVAADGAWLIAERSCISDPLPEHRHNASTDLYVQEFDRVAQAMVTLASNGSIDNA